MWWAGSRMAVGVGVAALLVAGCGRGAGPGGPSVADRPGARLLPAPAERTVAPRLTGDTVDGGTLDTATLRGQVVVVNVWGSWCAPCKKEQPDLQRVAAETAPLGVRFVGVDIRDSRAGARAHIRRYGVSYPSLFDPSSRLVAQLRPPATAIPSSYVVDRRGRVAAVLFGPVGYTELDALVRRIAAEPG